MKIKIMIKLSDFQLVRSFGVILIYFFEQFIIVLQMELLKTVEILKKTMVGH